MTCWCYLNAKLPTVALAIKYEPSDEMGSHGKSKKTTFHLMLLDCNHNGIIGRKSTPSGPPSRSLILTRCLFCISGSVCYPSSSSGSTCSVPRVRSRSLRRTVELHSHHLHWKPQVQNTVHTEQSSLCPEERHNTLIST